MLAPLKNHPFSVKAFFKSSLVLTFAVPKEELEPLIPECLTLDTFDNKWAFIAVAMVQTKNLRPKGFPKVLGNNFFLMGYRIFVRYTNNSGKRLRGLYILKSKTDNRKMTFLGNLFTHYNYSTTDIDKKEAPSSTIIKSKQSKFKIEYHSEKKNILLPEKSPFKNWKEARRFAGPLPFTFTYNKSKKEVLIIQGLRSDWKPKPVDILSYNVSFLKDLKLKQPVLANAFIVENIPYQWKKGKKELWKENNFKEY